MEGVFFSLLILSALLALTVWTLHAGGIRRSASLTRLENRFPSAAVFFQLASPDKVDELEGVAGKEGVGRTASRVLAGTIGIVSAIAFLALAVYFVVTTFAA